MALRLRGNRIALEAATEGGSIVPGARFSDDRDHSLDLPIPGDIRQRLPVDEPCWTMLVSIEDRLEIMPVRVEEHGADILGPRIFDEVSSSHGMHPPEIVRHVVRGLGLEEWTERRVTELEDLICAEPFARDPVPPVTAMDDWVGWRSRREILLQPAFGDEALHRRLVKEVFCGQRDDGSWDGSVTKTACGVLHALAVEVRQDDPRVRSAAEWLLQRPEPAARPGLWVAGEELLKEWSSVFAGRTAADRLWVGRGIAGEQGFVMQQEQQRIVPTCTRGFSGMCDGMLHTSAIAADALCRCGYADHPRLKSYAHSMTQLAEMYGYFCSCWGIWDVDRKVEDLGSGEADFNRPERREEYDIALGAIPYRYGRDAEDLLHLARCPQAAGFHRPDLADANGWSPYSWRDIGVENHYALVGAYWQNADCWARANRALTQYTGCVGSLTEFFALFQCHLYQTSLGEWDQGFPGGILRYITEVTRLARARNTADASPALRLAKLMVLRTIPWLREHQKEDGLWHHEDLPCWGDTGRYPAMSPRLGTYHILSALHAFDLLETVRPVLGGAT